jgi:hypothetical protein
MAPLLVFQPNKNKQKYLETHQNDLIICIGLFYLFIFSNYSDKMFTCYQQNILNHSVWVRYIGSFVVFYFLVSLTTNTGYLIGIPPIEKLLYSIWYFLLLILTMRMDLKIQGTLLMLLFISYFIETNKNYYQDAFSALLGTSGLGSAHTASKEDKQIIKENNYWFTLAGPYFIVRAFPVNKNQLSFLSRVQNLLYYVMVVSFLIGVIAYRGEALSLYPKGSWISRWITPDEECRFPTQRESLFTYFKRGLGIGR